MTTIITKCTASFCNSETIENFTDYCWECYDRISENYENKNTNPQWEDYKLEEEE
tara:strand:- start:1776 stop:1940 length:165 start_codon:yes stop_codon:yes gene_type:complete